VLALCSVCGLYRAFPPPDSPVYVRPQLKPPCGICSFTTATFGAHRGADQGAGRSTSGRDLLRLLGGSTSALPPSTAGLLQLPGLTSTRLGRHTAVPDLHRHLRADTRLHRASIFYVPAGIFYVPAGIFMSRPAYMGLGSTSAFPGLTYDFPGRNMFFPGRYSRLWAGIGEFRPLLAGIIECWADSGLPWALQAAGIPAGPPTSAAPRPAPRSAYAPARSASRLNPGPLRAWAASQLGRRFSSGWAAPRFRPRLGLGPSTTASPPSRPEFLPASWAAPRQASPAWARILLGCAVQGTPAPAGQATDDPVMPASVPAAVCVAKIS
jgi:hypothetical protein